jgi:hypothetical protein
MIHTTRKVSSVIALLLLMTVGLAGQSTQPPAQPSAGPAPVKGWVPTARVQIVLSRYNGEKKVASQPYVLVTVANGNRKVLRTGAEVPVAGPIAPDKSGTPYKSIGTEVHCELTLYDDGRYLVSVNVNASSLYPDDSKLAARATFRNYSLSGMAYLKDGQSAEIATATDGLTGEVIKAEVTVNAVK